MTQQTERMIPVHPSELEKIRDTLAAASEFFRRRDEMNGCLHLARETRWSPLTSEVVSALERVVVILLAATPKAEEN